MAWHSGKPADSDLLSASAQYIRENFAELEPLQPHVAELVDLAALQPHVAALLDSRIVDHNLDVADPPNGWYIRLATGLQLCLTASHTIDTIDESVGGMVAATGQWVLPAPFSSVEYYADFSVIGTGTYWSHPAVRAWPWNTQVHAKQAGVFWTRLMLADTSLTLPPGFALTGVMAFAIGRW